MVGEDEKERQMEEEKGGRRTEGEEKGFSGSGPEKVVNRVESTCAFSDAGIVSTTFGIR